MRRAGFTVVLLLALTLASGCAIIRLPFALTEKAVTGTVRAVTPDVGDMPQ